MATTFDSAFPRVIEKLGQNTTPGGGAGNANPQTITDSVQKIGPLPEGAYVIEGDVEMYALQGLASVIDAMNGDDGPSNSDIRAIGRRVPPKNELEFTVGRASLADDDATDGYIYWCKAADAADGTNFRCSCISRSKTS